MKDIFTNKNNTSYTLLHVLLWELIQIAFILLFIYLVYFQENNVLKLISAHPQPKLESAIHDFLLRIQLDFLWGQFWRLFLPLTIIALGMILFKQLRWYFIGICGMLFAFLLAMDRIYFMFFNTIPSTASLAIANQLWDVQSSVYNVITIKDILSILIYFIFFVMAYLGNRFLDPSLNKSPSAFIIDKIIGISIFLLAIHSYNVGFYIPKRYVELKQHGELIISKSPIEAKGKGIVPKYNTSHKEFAATFGILNFHLKDVVQSIKGKQKKALPDEVFQATEKYFEHKQALNETTSEFGGIAKGRNIFLIHLESFHPLLINLSINGEPVTPTLNNLIKKGLYWPNILDQILAGGSSDAEYSVMTGLMPDTEKLASFEILPNMDLIGLPETLRALGYHTYSFHANDADFWNRDINQRKLGFEKLFFKKYYSSDKIFGMGVGDRIFFEQSLKLLEKQKEPFFAFFMTLSTHHPFDDIPEGYQKMYTAFSPEDSTTKKYFQLSRYTDDALGFFIKTIKEMGYWKNSVFVFYGDHKPYVDNVAFEKATGQSIEAMRNHRVPLIILIPGQEKLIANYKNEYTDNAGGLYDIFPTILHLLGEKIPCGIYGTHLFVHSNKRDATPLYRNLDGFVYDNVYYSMSTQQPVRDKFGLIYEEPRDSVIMASKVIYDKYYEALNAIRAHKIIYEYAIQKSLCN